CISARPSAPAESRRYGRTSPTRDRDAFRDCLDKLYPPSNRKEIPDRTIAGLSSLILSDMVTFNVMRPRSGDSMDFSNRLEITGSKSNQESWRRVMPEHPGLTAPDLYAHRVSDLDPDWLESRVYREFFRKFKFNHQLCKPFHVSERVVIGSSFSRD